MKWGKSWPRAQHDGPINPQFGNFNPLGFFASVRSTLEYDPSTSGRCDPERWKSTANPVCKWHASQGSPEARLGCTGIMGEPWGEHGMRPSNGVLHCQGETLFLARQTLGTIC